MRSTTQTSTRRLILSALLFCLAGTAGAAELGIEGSRFTIDRKPTFLLGMSYYGALGAPQEFIGRDLDDLERFGFNWIRVWATWGAFANDVSAVDRDGKPREPYLSRLARLISECDRRGIIVDVTLTRGGRVAGPPGLQSLEAHRRAVETLLTKLKSRRNWYLDLGNERNIKDARFVSFDDLEQLRKIAKRLDARRLITASHAGGEMTQDDLRTYVMKVQLDFVCPHRPRNARSARETEDRTRQYLAWMEELGRVVPVHFQEPFRRGFTRGWEPSVDDYLTDARGALRGGAAGWCFHNGDERHKPYGKPRRSFDMRTERLFDQLDNVERQAVERLRRVFDSNKGAKQ